MPVEERQLDFVDVKLAAPPIRPGTVAKTDVIERLSASPAPLATVVAPAGYGKTTLLARWAEADSRDFAWVALDGRDDDPVVFLRSIVAAIDRVEPVPAEVFDALSGPGGANWLKRTPRVGRAVGALERPLVLALDDLHTVANPACLDVLAALIEYVPPGSLIAVAGRHAPALPLARWRAHGRLEEVGVAELRLDRDEAGLLLQDAGVELDGAELSRLTERTEGWPAGLYLAALSMQAGAPSSTAFTGDDRFVAEYFRLELLSRLPADEARFLTYTSVLDRMCGELCDAVVETTESARVLEALEGTNGFVVPLDRRGEWYRYHHLFGELLGNELERREPDLVPVLNGRAMAWCIANGHTEEAVAYGRAAGETDTVAGLIDALALPMYWDGRLETVEEWMAWFGEDELVQYPALAVYGAWTRALTGRIAEAERWLALADGATSRIPLSDGSATIEPWVATLRACMMAGGPEQAVADADRALEQLPAASGWRAPALVTRGVAHALAGAEARALTDLEAGVERGLALGAIDDVSIAHAQLALLAARRGAWGEAAQRARAAQELVDDSGLGDYATSAIVHVATARVALHETRHQEAGAALARVHRLRPQLDHGLPWLTVQVGLELTRAHLALTEAGAAHTILTETERVLELRPRLGFLADDARELRSRVDATNGSAGAWAMSLTAAELRLLPYLATHLTFPEIASRLFLSRNTVKTEAVGVYRKLGASSRSEAIARAIEVGLLESSIYPPRANFTPDV